MLDMNECLNDFHCFQPDRGFKSKDFCFSVHMDMDQEVEIANLLHEPNSVRKSDYFDPFTQSGK